MQNAECRMQNAECRRQTADGRRQSLGCGVFLSLKPQVFRKSLKPQIEQEKQEKYVKYVK